MVLQQQKNNKKTKKYIIILLYNLLCIDIINTALHGEGIVFSYSQYGGSMGLDFYGQWRKVGSVGNWKYCLERVESGSV